MFQVKKIASGKFNILAGMSADGHMLLKLSYVTEQCSKQFVKSLPTNSYRLYIGESADVDDLTPVGDQDSFTREIQSALMTGNNDNRGPIYVFAEEVVSESAARSPPGSLAPRVTKVRITKSAVSDAFRCELSGVFEKRAASVKSAKKRAAATTTDASSESEDGDGDDGDGDDDDVDDDDDDNCDDGDVADGKGGQDTTEDVGTGVAKVKRRKVDLFQRGKTLEKQAAFGFQNEDGTPGVLIRTQDMAPLEEGAIITGLRLVCAFNCQGGCTNSSGKITSYVASKSSIKASKMGMHWTTKHGHAALSSSFMAEFFAAVIAHACGIVQHSNGEFSINEAAESAPPPLLQKSTLADVNADGKAPSPERLATDFTAWLYQEPGKKVVATVSGMASFFSDCFVHSPKAANLRSKKTDLARMCVMAAAVAEKARESQAAASSSAPVRVVRYQVVFKPRDDVYSVVYDDALGDGGYTPANSAMVAKEQEPGFSGSLFLMVNGIVKGQRPLPKAAKAKKRNGAPPPPSTKDVVDAAKWLNTQNSGMAAPVPPIQAPTIAGVIVYPASPSAGVSTGSIQLQAHQINDTHIIGFKARLYDEVLNLMVLRVVERQAGANNTIVLTTDVAMKLASLESDADALRMPKARALRGVTSGLVVIPIAIDKNDNHYSGCVFDYEKALLLYANSFKSTAHDQLVKNRLTPWLGATLETGVSLVAVKVPEQPRRSMYCGPATVVNTGLLVGLLLAGKEVPTELCYNGPTTFGQAQADIKEDCIELQLDYANRLGNIDAPLNAAPRGTQMPAIVTAASAVATGVPVLDAAEITTALDEELPTSKKEDVECSLKDGVEKAHAANGSKRKKKWFETPGELSMSTKMAKSSTSTGITKMPAAANSDERKKVTPGKELKKKATGNKRKK